MLEDVNIDKVYISGNPRFSGTRVFFSTLFDYLEGGYSIDEFLLDFPTVTRDQVLRILNELQTLAIDQVKARNEAIA